MRHTPDAVVDALDDLFEARLRGDRRSVDGRLREDLRLRVEPRDDAVWVAFRLRGRERRDRLRDGDPFLATYADEVDERLRAWGVAPPDGYEFAETDGTWDVYAAVVGA